MAIRHRRGDYGNFEPSKMVAGEFAFVNSSDPNTDDGKAVYGTFTGGRTKRLCTYDEVKGLVDHADEVKTDVEQLKDDVVELKDDVIDLKDESNEYYMLSKSYAVGTDDEVRQDSEDNAKYYKEWVENAFDMRLPEITMDFETGNLMYVGGVLTFIINQTTGMLEWYM